MRVVEVVFEEEIKTFGLEIGEVVEIVREAVREMNDREGYSIAIELRDWFVRDGTEYLNIELAIKAVSSYIKENKDDFLRKSESVVSKLLENLNKRLEYYNAIKPFLHIYSKNGNSNREIFEKAGIEIIS